MLAKVKELLKKLAAIGDNDTTFTTGIILDNDELTISIPIKKKPIRIQITGEDLKSDVDALVAKVLEVLLAEEYSPYYFCRNCLSLTQSTRITGKCIVCPGCANTLLPLTKTYLRDILIDHTS